MGSHRRTRNTTADNADRIAAIEEKLDTIMEYVNVAAGQKNFGQMIQEEASLLGLKWTEACQVTEALEDPDKVSAIERLLLSNLLSSQMPKYMDSMFKTFFDESLRGHMFLDRPHG